MAWPAITQCQQGFSVLLSFQFKKSHIQSAIFCYFCDVTSDFSRIGQLNGMIEFRRLGEKMPVPYVFLRISHTSGEGERGGGLRPRALASPDASGVTVSTDIGTPHAQREIQLEA